MARLLQTPPRPNKVKIALNIQHVLTIHKHDQKASSAGVV